MNNKLRMSLWHDKYFQQGILFDALVGILLFVGGILRFETPYVMVGKVVALLGFSLIGVFVVHEVSQNIREHNKP